jgi:cytochrome c553
MIRRTVLATLLLTASLSANASTPAPAAADATAGQQIAGTICAGCHGADGNSQIPVNPILAGQHPEYLFKQMSNFKSADGKPAVRNNAIMNGMIASLSEQDMKNVAAWFAGQKINPATAKDETLIAQGRKLWRAGDLTKGIPACAGCHGAAGAGLPAQYPRLAGQFAEYTDAQLKAFRNGDRTNDPEKMMRMIAAKMNDQEIKAVAEYAAGLR